MKLLNYINQPKSFNNLIRQALNELSGNTSLQLRHRLKENWDNWVLLLTEVGIYDDIDKIIFKRYYRDIKSISKIKPANLELPEINNEASVMNIYEEITKVLEDYKNLTMNALLWATLCNSSSKDRLKNYLVDKHEI